ncbi:SapC family protein [Pedomonas mirosovicensis]|uniref:SapC family protein n=1 Tax=Pedomonas mirosovicensis TaxID=2908641 RepID=UPI0021671853|nr:SapC family protein [Pedomonas mirosovicensis]MCH8683751.1 SapC family protein [Pedomonas mirosovicensis]
MTTNSTAPAESRLPLFYNSVVPLSPSQHAKLVMGERQNFKFSAKTHAIPLTVDEFVVAQRHFPIIFGPGDVSVPLALVGLREGQNLFVDENGQWQRDIYIPGYVRRYPFVLARLSPESQDLSLCFDEKCDLFSEGEKSNLFEGTEPSETTKGVLQFCEQFEMAVQRTRAFAQELKDLDLLMEGEAQIQPQGGPASQFRGFRMINEQKLKDLRGDQHRKLVQSGALGLIYAHLFSLNHMQSLFGRQMQQDTANAVQEPIGEAANA